MSKHQYSVHHLIPQSHKPELDNPQDINNPMNKEKIRDTTHVNFHKVFTNKSPQQQLIHILEFNKKIFKDDFVKEIIKVLDKYIYNYYKVNTHIESELGSLMELEQEYFSNKRQNEA